MLIKKQNEIIAKRESEEDHFLDRSLRPQKLSEFIGQEKLKKNLSVFIEAAEKRNEPPEHILLQGGPGLGKTTLAHIIANEVKTNIRVTSGPALERPGDLAAILTNLEDKEILFIDECHRLNKTVEEILYPAMEDFALDLILGKGPSAKTLRLDLPHFTLIGATTRPSLLSSPLRDRFGVTYQLDFYQKEDLEKIILRSAKILNIKIDSESAKIIARRARFTPRIANRLLKRIRDYGQVKEIEQITSPVSYQALEMLEIDEFGLTPSDRKILEIIISKFKGGPVGIKTLSIASGEDLETLEEIYEPYLIQMGFLNRTSRGRIAMDLAYKHLKIRKTNNLQLITNNK